MPKAARLEEGLARARTAARSGQGRLMESTRGGDRRHAAVDAELAALALRLSALEAALAHHVELRAHLPVGDLNAGR